MRTSRTYLLHEPPREVLFEMVDAIFHLFHNLFAGFRFDNRTVHLTLKQLINVVSKAVQQSYNDM